MTAPIITNLKEKVIQALRDHPRTKEAIIDVVDRQGVITLTGTVPSWEIRQAAEEIASQQDGVITVINDLGVE